LDLAISLEHQNESGLPAVEGVLKLNPVASRRLKYVVMVHLAAAGRVLARGRTGRDRAPGGPGTRCPQSTCWHAER
jgi:hypothetical protein